MVGLAFAKTVGAGDPRRYRADIDGLRAVAVTSVVLFHAGLAPFYSGFVGVDVFFVISGYLIGELILRDVAAGEFSYLRFYARRARRILPALFLVVLATCIAGAFLFNASEYRDVGIIGTLALVGASNINFWQFQDYFADDSRTRVFLMTWSLGVEEQFYVVFPFLVILICRFARRRLVEILGVIALASFLLSVWWTAVSPVSAFYLLPARAWELGAGTLLAAVETGRTRGWRSIPIPSAGLQNVVASIALAAIVISITCFDEHTPFPGFAALLPVLGAVGLILVPDSWINGRLLGNRPTVFVGRVSYSWYLWHWPIMSVLRTIATKPVPPLAFVGVAAVSFLLAVLSWRFVEQPFRRARSPAGTTLMRYAVALAVMAAITVTINVTRGLPIRLPPNRDFEVIRTAKQGKCVVVAGAALGTDPSCLPSPADTRPVLAIIGDSHAWALSTGIRDLLDAQGFALAIYTRSTCLPLQGVSTTMESDPDFPRKCRQFNAAVRRALVADPRIKTVVLAGVWSSGLSTRPEKRLVADPGSTLRSDDGLALLRAGLEATVATLRAAGKQVVLVQDVPLLPIDPGRIALAEAIPARRLLDSFFDPSVDLEAKGTIEAEYVPRHENVMKIIADVAAQNHLQLVDPFPRFCGLSVCRYANASGLLYFDSGHLTPLGARVGLEGVRFDTKLP